MDEIKISVGDTVVKKDGVVGKVTEVVEKRTVHTENTYQECKVLYETGATGIILTNGIFFRKTFYRIGGTIIGAKITEEQLQEQIDYQREKCRKDKERLDQLRKQMFRLKEQMRPDWKERAEERRAEAKARKEGQQEQGQEQDEDL